MATRTGPATPGPGTPVPVRRGGRNWRQITAVFMVVLVLLVGGGVLAGRALLHRYESAVGHDVLLDERARDVDSFVGWRNVAGPLNYLLIGSDLRAANPDAGQRSDTILIVQVNAALTQAHLISIPRDLRVEIPAFPLTGYRGAKDKINAAFEFGGGGNGGVQLLSATLTELTGIRFDGAAVIDFGGFVKVIDTLGGVKLCVDTPVTSIHTGRVFAVGCRNMTGAEALDFSRQRYGLPNGDYDRQRHQQQLVKSVLDKALASGVARNPIKLDLLIRGIGQSLTVDTGAASITELALALRNIRPDGLVGVRVPSHITNIDGVSYVVLDDQSDGLFQAMRDGMVANWAKEHPRWVNSI
ncbi:LCP family protein [Catellatospora tritici]|uniref:LCP family protein n=1 Tax=Catellatospora tritici TaxID=2851566 RepID=UPI003FD8DB98